MRDYAEVWLSMKVKLRKLEEAINQKNYDLADTVATEIVVESRTLEAAVNGERTRKSYI